MSAAVVADMPHEEYLRHPALSFSGAKLLLPPSCPARFKWERDNPPPSKPHFDFGTAVHTLLFGGRDIEVVQKTLKSGEQVDADGYQTKSAQEHRDAIYAAGKVPLLRDDYEKALRAALAVRAHPIAEALFDDGKPEESWFWHDSRYGVDRRARTDWRTRLPDGRPVGVDLKTTISAEPGAIAKAVANYHYEQQHGWYADALTAGTGEPHAYLFIFVEKEPPHLVTVCELDEDAVTYGRRRNDRALEVYAECLATDTWPGHVPDDDIPLISLPPWALREDFTAA